jgi:xanthine dehydrogenase iron-sulfur cluster and FAD-binding subunit A
VKPSAFTYHRPTTSAEALAVLAEVGPHGKVLAGGQSLLPLLNMRLAAPAHLIDINRVTELAYLRSDPAGVRVGALTRHARVERDDGAASVQPLLRQALHLVAHPTIRNRGTVVGSLAHADPSGELTAVLALTGGTVSVAGACGERSIPAEEFFVGPLESAIRPGELAVEAFFPALAARSGTAFLEVARRHGDYAVCGVATIVTLDGSGAVVSARAGYVSMGPTPIVLDLTAQAPSGTAGDGPPLDDPATWSAAGEAAAGQLDPDPDIHATAAYRSQLARVLTARALARATASASALSASPLSARGHPTTDYSLQGAPVPNNPAPDATARGHPMTDYSLQGAPVANRTVPNNPVPNNPVANNPVANRTVANRTVPNTRAPEQVLDLQLNVNGRPHRIMVPVRRLLSDCLRHDLGLTGTHVGCEHGVCGACTVLLDGAPVRSCLILAAGAEGCEITTVEGLAEADGGLSRVQEAFRESHALQCGFCTPGFLTTVTAFLDEVPNPSLEQAREAIAGNLCRCTGYQNIVTAVRRAAELRRGSGQVGEPGRPGSARVGEPGQVGEPGRPGSARVGEPGQVGEPGRPGSARVGEPGQVAEPQLRRAVEPHESAVHDESGLVRESGVEAEVPR